MQNIFPVIDTHSIKHVINHIIPDSIFKIYIYLFVWIFFIYSGFIHKFMDNDIEVRNDLLWITFSILTFRHCFKLHHHLLFLLFISHSHILPISSPPFLSTTPTLRQPNPPHSKQHFKNFFVLLLIYFLCFIFTQHCPIFSFTGSDFLHLFTFEKLLPEPTDFSPFPIYSAQSECYFKFN